MIIADKLEVLDEEGNVNTDRNVTYSRLKEGSYFNELVLEGIESIYDSVKLDVVGNRLVLSRELDESKPINAIFIGEQFGVAIGTKVKIQLMFLDEGMFVTVIDGFINLGTDKEPFYYKGNTSATDEAILERGAFTSSVDHNYLLSTLSAVSKDTYKTVETMYELEIKHDTNGVFSYKTLEKYDLSNGKIEEQERLEREREELKKKQELEAKERRRRAIAEQKVKVKEKELKEQAEKNKDVKAMFDNLLKR